MRACVPNEETPWDERNRECLVKANEGRDAQPKGAEKPTGKQTKHIAHITTHEVSTHTHTWHWASSNSPLEGGMNQ